MGRFFDKVRNFLGIDRDPQPETQPQLRREPVVIPESRHGIDIELVADAAIRTVEGLHRKGFKAYIVGGAVRDLIAGIRPKDFDVATDATPEQVRRCFRRSRIIGRRFKIVHVIWGREIIEVATFRALGSEGVEKDSAGRVIDDNVFGEMWEDAARRDFTVNALFYDPETGEVLDYHNGVEDMKRGLLRMIGSPSVRYREDPVRMMRAVRISAKLGFSIEKRTREPIACMAHLLANVPEARLYDEILKILMCGSSVACVEGLNREGLLATLLPSVAKELSGSSANRFVMRALAQTDERLHSGKHVSPVFLFATLLWPDVVPLFEGKASQMPRTEAMSEAVSAVLDGQAGSVSIPRRLAADIRDIWMTQLRFERRRGRAPYRTLEMPRFRAAYDFLLLRVQNGEANEELADWWDAFARDEASREDLIASTPRDPRPAARPSVPGEAPASVRRRRRRRPHPRPAAEPQNPS